MKKSIIIIGGGLTGLSAGCYGQMNDYNTTIFEMHDKAGGVCTGWKRKGYTIDGAMNWLVGTDPGSSFYKFWEELGAAQDWIIYYHDRYSIKEDQGGNTYTIYCDADLFEEYLLKMGPEDSDLIKEFTQAIRTISKSDMPSERPPEFYNEADRARIAQMMPYMQPMQKWQGVTFQDFAKRLKNPNLRRFFENGPAMPVTMMFWVLGFQHSKSAGYVVGGALALVKPIEKRYRKLGGEIRFNSRVEKILVENDKAVGVRLADGQEYRADYIISAGDGHTAIFDLIDGKYVDDIIKQMYERPVIFPPLVYVGLGIKRKFDDIPSSVGGYNFPLKKSITIAGREEKSINMMVYNFDPTLAPEGKTTVVVLYSTSYDYWHQLRQDLPRYKAEKERIAGEVIAGLEEKFPGIALQVEMRDVATPVTWERYTGNWRGAYEGWMFGAHDNISKTLPGLDNLYMAGQWVNAGGGMPTAAMSGCHTIQFICQRDGKKFITTKP
ncbi:MAG: NAD(P)/FAD-dependent oxidoreductase [Dehalococcoidales bacterium]|nr:NAD(P)/FAD-dependent oxidoreductase [Dehalococcoidales bacterium]